MFCVLIYADYTAARLVLACEDDMIVGNLRCCVLQIRADYAAAEGAFTAILAEDPHDREVLAAMQLMKEEQMAMREDKAPPVS